MFFDLVEVMEQMLMKHKVENPADRRSDVDIMYGILCSGLGDEAMFDTETTLWSMRVHFEEGAELKDLYELAQQFVRMFNAQYN